MAQEGHTECYASFLRPHGEVEWYGNVQLSVGGKITGTQYFKNESINPEELNNPSSSYLGTATFALPITDQSVRAIINVGYILNNEQGRGGRPYPTTITHYIILQK